MDRRSLLKSLAAAATLTVVPSGEAAARERRVPQPDAIALLYDSTKCIGCKACVVGCKDEGELPADVSGYGGGLYDAPDRLNEYTRNIIQLYKEDDGNYAFVKKQCMHCIDPACVSACMLGALNKGELGVVSWQADRCIGCRYCQVACPFGVPKFEWTKAAPKLVKCDFCIDRVKQGKEPACVESCPRDAVIFGNRAELLQEAHRRIDEKTDVYIPKVYGETELGGTQALYLSHVEFDKLGFEFDHSEPAADVQQTVQHGIYRGFIAPVALYGLLGAVIFRNRRKSRSETEEETKGE